MFYSLFAENSYNDSFFVDLNSNEVHLANSYNGDVHDYMCIEADSPEAAMAQAKECLQDERLWADFSKDATPIAGYIRAEDGSENPQIVEFAL